MSGSVWVILDDRDYYGPDLTDWPVFHSEADAWAFVDLMLPDMNWRKRHDFLVWEREISKDVQAEAEEVRLYDERIDDDVTAAAKLRKAYREASGPQP